MTATPAYNELAELLATSLKGTDARDWRNAMTATQTVGWTWTRTFFECALILKRGGGPQALRDAAGPTPLRHQLAQLRAQDHPENEEDQ